MKNSAIIGLSDLNLHLDDDIDLYICSASFEDRSFKISESLRKNIKRSIVFMNKIEKNETHKERKKKNAKKLKLLLPNSEIVLLSKLDPFLTSNQLIDSIYHKHKATIFRKPQNIVVDITTFTHETLLILYKVIDVFKREGENLTLLYNPAEDYCFNTTANEDKWLSKGIKEIRTVLGFPGYLSPYKKLHLIILVGYEIEKCLRLIEKYEPSLLSFGMPDKNNSINDSLHSINLAKYHKLLATYPSVNEFNFSCLNPDITKTIINGLVKKFKDYNTIIAPMNNKISTIGAGLAAKENREIQICYAKANLYNTEDYSLASNSCIIYRF